MPAANACQVLLMLPAAPPGAILARVRAGAGAGVVVGGPLVAWPGEVQAQMDQLDASVDAFKRDVDAGKDEEFKRTFAEWVHRWKAWKSNNYSALSLFWNSGGIEQQTAQWEENLKAWREQYAKRGGGTLSPMPKPAPAPPMVPPPVLNTLDNVSMAVTAAAVGAVVIFAVKTFKGG